MTPWELSPALLRERLEVVAQIAVTTRNRAFAEADRAAGDTNWGLACKAHERLMHALSELCERNTYPWLTIVREGLYLMPIVDGVPVRLYRGSPERLSSRHLDAARLEHHRLHDAAPLPQLAFDFMGGGGGASAEPDGPWYWMMAMETDATGRVTRVVFHQANDAGETRNCWVCEITVDTASAKAETTTALQPARVVQLADKRASRENQRARHPKSDAVKAPVRQEGLLFGDASGAE